MTVGIVNPSAFAATNNDIEQLTGGLSSPLSLLQKIIILRFVNAFVFAAKNGNVEQLTVGLVNPCVFAARNSNIEQLKDSTICKSFVFASKNVNNSVFVKMVILNN